jgi:G2/mitotic-specific cyclin-B, other
MSGQAEINDKMRAILIDWLIEVHHKFKLQPETLFITARIIDKYLELEQVSKSRLQLVGVTALLLASKYEEIYPPELKDFVFITDKAYNKEDVLQMEFSILSSLSFDLTFPTAHRFIERYARLLGCDSRVINFAYFLSELALIDIRMLQYNSSVTAASSLILAYKIVTSGIENAFSL